MKARSLLLVLLLSFSAAAANAGDISSFVNLGFSPDSKSFMFGLFGIHSADNLPFAEAYLVDVQGNKFLPGGQLLTTGSRPATLNQDGSGALYNILHTIKPQIDKYRINHLELGRLVYILVNGQEQKPSISFKDYITDINYELCLNQKSRPMLGKTNEGASNESEFSIALSLSFPDGKTFTATVGRPGYFRESVDMYLIRQIMLSPDEQSLLFVIEKQERSKGSLSTSYMVETLSLK